MKQGLGRCYLALKESDNLNQFKDVVLWGCLHDISFDPQCEGTRADYIYNLTSLFDDEDYFLTPILQAFENRTSHLNLTFAHLAELLRNFAQNGNKTAKNANIFLNYKYHEQYFL